MAFQKVLAFKQALNWIQSLIIMKLTNNTEYYLMCFLNNKTMVDFDKLIVLHLIYSRVLVSLNQFLSQQILMK